MARRGQKQRYFIWEECLVCQVSTAKDDGQVVLYPCRHAATCEDCFLAIKYTDQAYKNLCPQCRQEVQSYRLMSPHEIELELSRESQVPLAPAQPTKKNWFQRNVNKKTMRRIYTAHFREL